MNLGEILSVTSEHTVVNVVDCATGGNVACYDGKNSIDSELNEKRSRKTVCSGYSNNSAPECWAVVY